MTVQIRGLQNLITKVNSLSHINGNQAVDDVVEEVERAIRAEIPKDTHTSEKAIGSIKGDMRESNSYTVQIGLKQSIEPWDKWKGAYYGHYGFHYKGTGRVIVKNVGWFDRAIKSSQVIVRKKVRDRLKQMIKEGLEK